MSFSPPARSRNLYEDAYCTCGLEKFEQAGNSRFATLLDVSIARLPVHATDLVRDCRTDMGGGVPTHLMRQPAASDRCISSGRGSDLHQ